MDEPGGNGVHPNAPSAELQRRGAGVHEHRRLRRRVVAVHECWLQSLDRGDVDDATPAGHARRRTVGHRHDAADVDTEHLGTIVRREIHEGRHGLDAGVVHHDVEPPEGGDRLIAEPIGIAFHIALDDRRTFGQFSGEPVG